MSTTTPRTRALVAVGASAGGLLGAALFLMRHTRVVVEYVAPGSLGSAARVPTKAVVLEVDGHRALDLDQTKVSARAARTRRKDAPWRTHALSARRRPLRLPCGRFERPPRGSAGLACGRRARGCVACAPRA